MTRATATSHDAPATLAPDRYELLSTLGQGAMGVVYQARDRELDRVVAIKTLQRHDGGAGPDFEAIAARLSREAMAAARLSHPGIVTVYDVGRHGGTPYVVMEYFTGRTLTALLQDGPLAPARAVQVAVEVCRALAYAHAQGVVHRDVKSSNIMVDESWHVKLTDFGVARIVDKPTNEAGMMIGTPAYMAPEQARGGITDARSDLYSVGVVLYEALTGQRPFPGEDVAQVLDDVVRVEPVPPREKNFAVSPALDAVVQRAMSKDPGDRYASGRLTGARGVMSVLIAALVLAAGVYVTTRAQEAPPMRREVPPVATAEALRDAQAAAPSPARVVPSVAPAAVASPAPERPAPAGKPGCLSVNAVPFATVFVDDREMGDTPQACLRLAPGVHRVSFQWSSRRSPDRTIEMTSEHTADNALRVSYDFRSGRFLTNAD